MSSKLALLGGTPLITESFNSYLPYGKEELDAARSVIESGVLSQFLGTWHEHFYGGPKVRQFESAWTEFFNVKNAMSVNSATSGLVAAVGALDIEPGDEIIVSPWTMSASATAILVWNAIPVFADIENETFNLDPVSIEKNITPRTKAIMVTDIYGHPADLAAIMNIAERHGLKVIEDAAQAPGALYHGRYAGTIADIGVFSLNYHKHIHTGEGGVCVTNDPDLTERMQLIRNHAEAVVSGKGVKNISNLIGFNFRLGEIEAALGMEQLKKLPRLVSARQSVCERLSKGLGQLRGLKAPVVKPDCTHVYYGYPLILDTKLIGVSREKIAAALTAEGVPNVGQGYTNLHLLPMYQRKIAYGNHGFPWVIGDKTSSVSYAKGICPVAEEFHDWSVLGLAPCMHEFSNSEIELVIAAFNKVWDNHTQLRESNGDH